MLTSITLSTGKTIRIPIFNNAEVSSVTVLTRAYAVLRDYSNGSLNNLVYSNVSDAELKELGYILLGVTSKELDEVGIVIRMPEPPPPYTADNGHDLMLMYWCYRENINKYVLAMPFSFDGTNIIADLENGFGLGNAGNVPVSADYYESFNVNPLQGSQYQNYYDYVSHAKEVGSIGWNAANVRPGSQYSLDILCSPDRNNIQIPANGRDEATIYANVNSYIEDNPDSGIEYTEQQDDYVDPYGNIISTGGGGDGDPSVDPDHAEKGEIPELPSLSAVDAGMITMYYCTNGQLQALANYLWTNIYDLETNFVKLFASPMDCIIGLGIVPVMPQLGGASAVHFGNISTSVYMTKLSSQFQEKDLGSVSIPKWIGCFLDYSPYVKISLYLPYIGYRELSADDVVGDTIHVVYHIDCLTGGCCAFVETGKKGLLYTFNGSCIANVPLTATNYSTAIQNAVSAVGSGLTTVAGIATGAAPIAAVGAASMLSNAANTAMNSKPSVQRSGSMGGAAGLMSYQRPMLIIERPRMCVPQNLNHFKGNTYYVTKMLKFVQGFATVEMINLDGVPCTKNERDELEALLKEGVYF